MCGLDVGRRYPAALMLGLLLACGRTEATTAPPPPPVNASALPPAPPPPPASASAPPLPEMPWPALVRDEQWDAAWKALEALPDDQRSRPEVRYVRARVALERDDAAIALPLLVDLEGVLPLLADDVARRRAEAKLSVGPFAEAGEWFAMRVSPGPQLDAARAFEKAHDARRARAAANRVVASERRTHVEEAEARALRVRLTEPPGDPERADARWLATSGADAPAASDALALVAKIDPKHPLAADELLLRARVLSDAGRPDDALRAIELAVTAPGADKVGTVVRERARGMVLYKARGRWGEAAKVLGDCATAPGVPDKARAEDAFYAARALSRADRDEEAIRGYEDVQRRYPKSDWGAQAMFFAPYLRMLHGEWTACARGFDAYLAAHPGGQDARDASRDGALCKLLSGQVKGARGVFEQLIEDEPDPS